MIANNMNLNPYKGTKIFTFEQKVGVVRYVASFIGVLVIGALLIAAQGEDPVNAAGLIVEGAFGGKIQWGNTIRWATPCLLNGIAAIIAFKSGVNNLGIEGQMYIGALTAGLIGFLIELPPVIHVVVCLMCAGLSGVVWVAIPAIMRLFFRINEYVTTMMMNFIATLFCDWLVIWVVIPALGMVVTKATTPSIFDSAELTTIVKGTTASTGFIIALVIVILVWALYKYTIIGYELKQVGENLKFAQVGGVNVKSTFLAIFALSGFCAGLCGGVEVCGGYHKYVSNFSTLMGWEGIMIANICNLNPIALIFVSLVWGALKTGAMAMERATTLNRLTVNLLQMIFVLCVSIDYEGIFRYFKDKKRKKEELLALQAAQKEG